MKLSKEQIIFLKRHKVPLWYILNAEWMSPWEYKKILNETDFKVALNSWSKKCEHHNLHIRDRHWQCVECRVSKYSFIFPKKDWYVYVLWSKKWKILKVGYTYDLKDRHVKINHDWYGWSNDWEIIYSCKYKKPLSIEFKLHARLKWYWVEKTYSHYGKIVTCYELYKCSYKTIKNEIINLNNDAWELLIWEIFELENWIELYNFSTEDNHKSEISKSYENDYDYYLNKYWIQL